MKYRSDQRVTLVVGGGITGLTAAYGLARAGVPCLLAEAQNAVGGLCRTFTVDGVPFDLGPHVFFDDPDAEVNRFTMDLLKDEKILSRPYRFAIQAKGRYWKFPVSPVEVLKYPWTYKKALFKAIIQKKRPVSDDPRSLAAFIGAKSGPLFYADLFEDLIEKKSLMSGQDLHCDWWLRVERNVNNTVEPFVPPFKAGRLGERLLRKLKPWYNYPQEGYGRIAEILWERSRALGVETVLNCGPIDFELSGNRVDRTVVKGRPVTVKNVIWTGSINTLNRNIKANVPRLPYVDMCIACLTFNQSRRHHRPFIYTYHPQKELIFNRIYYPSNIYGNDLPDGREGLCFEMNVTDRIRNMPEDILLNTILEGTARLGLYPQRALRQARFFWLKDALPVYPLDYQAKMKRVYGKVHAIENLFAVGRMGGHFFCLSPSAFNQGLKIVKHLLAYKQPAHPI